jgi:Protein of unknown function (DUF1236)
MKNTLLVTTAIVALVAGANFASAQRAEDSHGTPAVSAAPEQKAPEGKMKAQDATKHQKSDSAKPTSHAQVPDARTPGKASDSKNLTGQGAAGKTSQKEDTQLPSKGAAQNTGQGQSKSVSAPLSSEQHVRIRNMLRGEKTERLATGGFSISVGEAIPRTVHLYRLPLQLVESFPDYRNYEYVMVGEEILIVDPVTLQVIAVIPA